MLKLLKGIGYLAIVYYIIYSDHANYFQSNSFKLDIANYLVSLNSWEAFLLAIISFYLLLSWSLFGFTILSATVATILTTITYWLYSGHITFEIAQPLSELIYFLLMALGVYSVVAGAYNVQTFNIRVENYRPYRPFIFQLINVIATAGDEPESIKEYQYKNITRLMHYVDAKIGARDNEAGVDYLRGKKD